MFATSLPHVTIPILWMAAVILLNPGKWGEFKSINPAMPALELYGFSSITAAIHSYSNSLLFSQKYSVSAYLKPDSSGFYIHLTFADNE